MCSSVSTEYCVYAHAFQDLQEKNNLKNEPESGRIMMQNPETASDAKEMSMAAIKSRPNCLYLMQYRKVQNVPESSIYRLCVCKVLHEMHQMKEQVQWCATNIFMMAVTAYVCKASQWWMQAVWGWTKFMHISYCRTLHIVFSEGTLALGL